MGPSSVLHQLQSRAPRSRNRKERQREIALSKYAPLVKYVVDRLMIHLPKSVERDDLVSAAIIGLFDALEKYDASKGTKFETYAIWRIRGAILDELRSLDWASRSIRRRARNVEEVSRNLGQKLGRTSTNVLLGVKSSLCELISAPRTSAPHSRAAACTQARC